MTKLIEFQNDQQETLRGLLDVAQGERGVLFVHGYERTSVEYKFKNIADALKGEMSLLRFDFSGCGLSDGEFGTITAEKYAGEIHAAIEAFSKHTPRVKHITLVVHSFASCAVLKYIQEKREYVDRVVFLGPAWNQKALHRYWFTQSRYRAKKDELTISNFRRHFDEEIFQDFVHLSKRQSKAHYINKEYFVENEKMDYQDLLTTATIAHADMLIVHGKDDRAVPIESNHKIPKDVRVIRVEKGDHDLERVSMVEQYLAEVVDFIS